MVLHKHYKRYTIEDPTQVVYSDGTVTKYKEVEISEEAYSALIAEYTLTPMMQSFIKIIDTELEEFNAYAFAYYAEHGCTPLEVENDRFTKDRPNKARQLPF